jgi:hypothetical protein
MESKRPWPLQVGLRGSGLKAHPHHLVPSPEHPGVQIGLVMWLCYIHTRACRVQWALSCEPGNAACGQVLP